MIGLVLRLGAWSPALGVFGMFLGIVCCGSAIGVSDGRFGGLGRVRSLAFGVWCSVSGIWRMAFGVWGIGVWPLNSALGSLVSNGIASLFGDGLLFFGRCISKAIGI